MSKIVDGLAAGTWWPIMEFQGATFSRLRGMPMPPHLQYDLDIWRRTRPRGDGSVETRYAWDGDGKIVATLGEIAEAIERGPVD